ncbi:paraneoplastic antigen Ma3 homolog [Diadema antillarum]|uniref:paraneoplastic antigen Ma3 homolog n=1 Tax=Diadema antillarum TaxID=105358 RepID=UPI003A89A2E2
MSQQEEKSDFQAALAKLLGEHGKTLADLSLDPPVSSQSNPEVTIPKAVQETIVKHVVTSSSIQRRRLRLFSGRSPVPSGEFDFESWRRPAQQLVEDRDLSDSEKYNRIAESLLPPASDIIWALGKDVTAAECLEGLEKAYGSTTDGDELYLKFSECYQQEHEAAAEYLLRLQSHLSRALDAGGVAKERGDNVRVQQFLRGCLYNDPLLVALDLKRRSTPPTFVALLQEVRQEEQKQLDKAERRKGGHMGKKKAFSAEQIAASPSDERIAELQKQVMSLQQQLAATTNSFPRGPPRNRRRRRTMFCYNCGEDGHRMEQCEGETNAALVQSKMVSRTQSTGNDGGHQ